MARLLFLLAALMMAGASHASFSDCLLDNHDGDVCGVMMDEVLTELARNCTKGDVADVYAALASRCERLELSDDGGTLLPRLLAKPVSVH